MKNQDFHCSITAAVTPQEAMDAISNVSAWWGKNVEGNAEKLGDVFTIRFGETFVVFKITELIAEKRVAWAVTDCYLPWLDNKTEWNGTKVVFELSTENGLTKIDFTHEGLEPQLECFNDCVKGWTEYVTLSLLKLLKEGTGQPA